MWITKATQPEKEKSGFSVQISSSLSNKSVHWRKKGIPNSKVPQLWIMSLLQSFHWRKKTILKFKFPHQLVTSLLQSVHWKRKAISKSTFPHQWVTFLLQSVYCKRKAISKSSIPSPMSYPPSSNLFIERRKQFPNPNPLTNELPPFLQSVHWKRKAISKSQFLHYWVTFLPSIRSLKEESNIKIQIPALLSYIPSSNPFIKRKISFKIQIPSVMRYLPSSNPFHWRKKAISKTKFHQH